MRKAHRLAIAATGVKSATIKVNRKGVKSYSGTKQLRSTG